MAIIHSTAKALVHLCRVRSLGDNNAGKLHIRTSLQASGLCYRRFADPSPLLCPEDLPHRAHPDSDHPSRPTTSPKGSGSCGSGPVGPFISVWDLRCSKTLLSRSDAEIDVGHSVGLVDLVSDQWVVHLSISMLRRLLVKGQDCPDGGVADHRVSSDVTVHACHVSELEVTSHEYSFIASECRRRHEYLAA